MIQHKHHLQLQLGSGNRDISGLTGSNWEKSANSIKLPRRQFDQVTSPLGEQRRAAHPLHQELVLVLDRVLLLGAREYLPEPLLLVLINPVPSIQPRPESQTKKIREGGEPRSEKTGGADRGGPGVEVGGEVDEGLRGAAERLEDVDFVDGKGVGRRHAAPLRRLVLQRLHRSCCSRDAQTPRRRLSVIGWGAWLAAVQLTTRFVGKTVLRGVRLRRWAPPFILATLRRPIGWRARAVGGLWAKGRGIRPCRHSEATLSRMLPTE